MRADLLCVLLAALCICFVSPVGAVDMSIPALPPVQQVNLSEFDFYENNTFDVEAFFENGVFSPFLEILGDYFAVILYGLVLLLVYMRSHNLTLVAMLAAVSLGVWSVYLPREMFIPLLLLVILGISACLYRLFKNKN